MEPSVEKVLKRLESLSREDRRWVIERLPDSVKSVLLSGQATTDFPNPVIAAQTLAEYSSSAIAQVLASEPGWIVELLLRGVGSKRRKQVLFHLPATARATVTALQHSQTLVSRPVQDSLLRAARQNLDALSAAGRSDDDQPHWHRWFDLRMLRARVHL